MNRERREEVIDIANGLSNDDICFLLNLISDRALVFVGAMGGRVIDCPIEWVSLNGALIQISLESSAFDSIADHSDWWREAILEEAKRIRARARAEKKGGQE